jgi:hypothetical protein
MADPISQIQTNRKLLRFENLVGMKGCRASACTTSFVLD